MPCYSPLVAWRARYLNDSGKRPLVFKKEEGYEDMEVQLPCGQCRGCRLENSRQWAIRCVHEAQMHDRNSFITLTYNDENLPEDRSISKEVLQKFFKRLRRRIEPNKIRYFACGEYGEKKSRPHYHSIVFGYDFPDKILYSKTKAGDLLYRSRLLEEVWPYGFSSIGEVTFESAAYVARYVMKKEKYSDATDQKKKYEIDLRYSVVSERTGEVFTLEREFALMSRRPGLGNKWFSEYKGDLGKDFITVRGKKMTLPKYYDELLEEDDAEDLLRRKGKRLGKVKREDYTRERLMQKEKVKKAQINMLKRGYENEA